MGLKVGDKVSVVKYGHLIAVHPYMLKRLNKKWPVYSVSDDKKLVLMDMRPDIVGQEGIVVEVKKDQYAVDGIKYKHAWFNEEQLKKIE